VHEVADRDHGEEDQAERQQQIGRSALRKSRFGMSQPSANNSGGMNSAKEDSGSMCRLDSNGTNESSTPPATSSSGPGSGSPLGERPDQRDREQQRQRDFDRVHARILRGPRLSTPNAGALSSARPGTARSLLREERELFRRRRAAEDGVAMREAAEPEDHVGVLLRPASARVRSCRVPSAPNNSSERRCAATSSACSNGM
jgi:hypothetical protein